MLQRQGFALLTRGGWNMKAGEFVCPQCKVPVSVGGEEQLAPLSFLEFDDGKRMETSGVIA